LQLLGLTDRTAVLTVQGNESAMKKLLHQENQTSVSWKLASSFGFKLGSSSLHRVAERTGTKEINLIII